MMVFFPLAAQLQRADHAGDVVVDLGHGSVVADVAIPNLRFRQLIAAALIPHPGMRFPRRDLVKGAVLVNRRLRWIVRPLLIGRMAGDIADVEEEGFVRRGRFKKLNRMVGDEADLLPSSSTISPSRE